MIFSSIFALVCFFVICSLVAVIGARVTVPEIPNWYASIAMPRWTPPRLAFPIIWPILYASMAVSGWLIWALNAIWSPIFFGLHNLLAGLIVIILLIGAIAALIATAENIAPSAAALLVPSLAWTMFAAALNARIVSLN
jgi:translocator protein